MVSVVAALRVKRPRNRSSIPVQTTPEAHTASYSASNRDRLSSGKAVRADCAAECRMCCFLFLVNPLYYNHITCWPIPVYFLWYSFKTTRFFWTNVLVFSFHNVLEYFE